MKPTQLLTLITTLLAVNALAGSRDSADYSVPTDTTDAGGARAASAQYSNDGSAGSIGGISTVAAPSQTAKHSYIGQLYEVTSLALAANPPEVDEGATRQITANAVLDDTTLLAVASSSVGWSVDSGPIASINANGLATADNVYEDTAAFVQGSYLSEGAILELTVRNVGDDDYEDYAGDGLDDAWQVQYFGEGNPDASPGADSDTDGQTTGYENLVGSDPTDGESYFRMFIEMVPGEPTHRDIVFSPRVAGRTYSVQSTSDLGATPFADLTDLTISDLGIERIVTDINAVESHKLYRVRITKP